MSIATHEHFSITVKREIIENNISLNIVAMHNVIKT
jgi:hypothetical protein